MNTQKQYTPLEGGGSVFGCLEGSQTGCPLTQTSQIPTVTSFSLLEGSPDRHPPALSQTPNLSQLC